MIYVCLQLFIITLKSVNNYRGWKMKTNVFWIFGILQSLSLGFIIFLIFNSFNLIHGSNVIGSDTQIILSIIFPLFLLLTEYTILTAVTDRK